MMGTIFKGSTVLLTATFVDTDDIPTQMTTVTLKIITPDAVVTTISGASISYDSSIKEYSYVYTTTQAGRHEYIWSGTDSGSRVVVIEKSFHITSVRA